MSTAKFDEYRYHFKSLNITNQLDVFMDHSLMWNNKNKLLDEILISINYRNKGIVLKHITTIFDQNAYHLRIANKKLAKIEKDFQKELMDNEPSCNVFIWNNANEQKMLIESDKTSFGDSVTVAKILEKNINNELRKHGLSLNIRLEFQESEFWGLVKKHENEIESIEFNLIYPNLPAAFKDINEELKDLSRNIDSAKSSLGFKATKDDVLKNIVEENVQLNNLNVAASVQGSPITLKIRGIRSKIKTGKTRKTIIIDEFEVSATTPEAINQIVKKLFSK